MLAENIQIRPGMPVTSPGGRRLEVGDVFVPRNDKLKGRCLPSAFRQLGRKVVVFKDGSIAPLADVRRHFSELRTDT